MPPQALAAIATLLGFAVHGNRVELRLDHGSAELVWLTPSTFHFRRVLDGPLRPDAETAREPFVVQADDAAGEIQIRSRLLEVTIAKQGVLVRVRRINGATLMVDLTRRASEAGGVTWERQMQADADYFGLGPRTDPTFSLRGKSLAADVPLLVSSTGYGEYHPGGGIYHFDFTKDDRYRISGPEIDYYFYYGPTPKEILEEHNLQPNRSDPWTVNSDRFGSWGSLKASLLRIVEGGMAAANAPMLNLAPYNTAPSELQTRARQLGSLVARVSPGTVGLSGFRKQLDTFYGSYIAELQDRGFPIWHPLPFQVPDDPEGAKHTDEFLLGDEMLIAPLRPATALVYLPCGIWTNLETNQKAGAEDDHGGNQVSAGICAQRRVIPLDAPNGMALQLPQTRRRILPAGRRYRRLLAGACRPALDVIRLEIESRRTVTTSGWSTTPAGQRRVRYQAVPRVTRLEALPPTAGSMMPPKRICTSG